MSVCRPSAGRCAVCGRRFGCRRIKRVSDAFMKKWGIEHLLIAGTVVSNGAANDGDEVYFWTEQAADMCRDLGRAVRY